jgi:hypothetical protein
VFTSHLSAAFRDVARQAENHMSNADPSFSTENSQWIARSLTLNTIQGTAGGATSSAWFAISPDVYHRMLEQTLSGSAIAVEIERTLQHTHTQNLSGTSASRGQDHKLGREADGGGRARRHRVPATWSSGRERGAVTRRNTRWVNLLSQTQHHLQRPSPRRCQ